MKNEVYKNIYQYEIPLPNNPLKSTNTYIITSEKRNLIIDTGFNIPECEEAMMNAIDELGLDLNKTDLFITHLHSDHSGLAGTLKKKGINKVYAGVIDGVMINQMTTDAYWKKFNDYEIMFDLKRDNVSYTNHPGYKYCPKEQLDFTYVKENDVINIGDYSLRVIDIPGHTPGHIGLHEENHKLLFCGDHILGKITPNITFWSFDTDYLAVYFESLKKVYAYDLEYVFTAHRFIVRDHRTRIDELMEHHRIRLNEVLNIITDKKLSVRDTAAKMKWELRAKNWDEFPIPQKWFASGEAMSHLEHLVAIGKAEKSIEDKVIYYRAI